MPTVHSTSACANKAHHTSCRAKLIANNTAIVTSAVTFTGRAMAR